jgi:hypothetical protein
MTSVSKWVAAGSSAAVLAGGLFIGTPLAAAAPGDPACVQAGVQYEAALAAAGITEDTIARLEAASEAVAAAEETYMELFQAAEASAAAAVDAAVAELEAARAEVEATDRAKDAADASGDAAARRAAGEAHDAAEIREADALLALEEANAAFDTATDTEEIRAAQEALDSAVAAFEQELAGVSLDDATAMEIMRLFEAFLAACNPDPVGEEPVNTPVVTPPSVTTPVDTSGGTPRSTTPAGTSPVSTTPVGAAPVGGTTAVPVAGVNRGLNVQTAAAAEPADHPGLALLAGLLAAGIAVPAVVALRMRRLQRARR